MRQIITAQFAALWPSCPLIKQHCASVPYLFTLSLLQRQPGCTEAWRKRPSFRATHSCDTSVDAGRSAEEERGESGRLRRGDSAGVIINYCRREFARRDESSWGRPAHIQPHPSRPSASLSTSSLLLPSFRLCFECHRAHLLILFSALCSCSPWIFPLLRISLPLPLSGRVKSMRSWQRGRWELSGERLSLAFTLCYRFISGAPEDTARTRAPAARVCLESERMQQGSREQSDGWVLWGERWQIGC